MNIVAKKRYQAVGFPYNRMLKLSSSKGIRIDVPVLYVSWSLEDHSVIIQALFFQHHIHHSMCHFLMDIRYLTRRAGTTSKNRPKRENGKGTI